MSLAIAAAPAGMGFVLVVSVIVFVAGAAAATPIGSFLRSRFDSVVARRAGGHHEPQPRVQQPSSQDRCTCHEKGAHSCPNRFAL